MSEMSTTGLPTTPPAKVQIWVWSQLKDDPWSPLQRGTYTMLLVLELLVSSIIIALLIRKRNSYPVNATPVFWNVLTHMSPILCAIFYGFDDVVNAMEMHPVGLFMLVYSCAWPMGPAICARLLHVARTYQAQIRIEKRQKQLSRKSPGGGSMAVVKHQKHMSKEKEVALFFAAVSAINLLFPCGIILDRFVLKFEKDADSIIDFSPGMFVTGLSLLMDCFVFAFLAFKLKKTKEEFNLKAQYLVFSIWALFFESGNLIMIFLGIHRKSGNLLLLARFCIHATNSGCTLFLGALTLMFSFREDRKMKRRMAQRSDKVSSTNVARLYTVKTANDLKKICTNPKNSAQLDMFQAYTIKEFCVENVLCARAIMQLSDISDKTKLLEAVQRILNEHIRSGVQAEVNVADGLRKAIIKTVSDLTVETVTSTVYQEVEYQLYIMLLNSFNRFLVKENVVLDIPNNGQSV